MQEPVLPSWLKDEFNYVHKPAIRAGQRGRGSGGTLLLINKNLKFQTLLAEDTHIFIELEISQENIVIGCMYLNSNCNVFNVFENISLSLSHVFDDLENKKILIVGDMNSHIGELGTLDESVVFGTCLSAKRTSKHKNVETRGEELLSCTENLGLSVLNGRTIGDIPAQLTFIDTREKQTGENYESSVLDLIFCNVTMMPDIHRMEVLDTIHTSHHLPVTLTCILPCLGETQESQDTRHNTGI
uniref:Endonuclease/exonuclease/phosphatase domain-containing protein n=1 Tax=Cacopsylla melanoneura TaxID=428564 RepID=A0A8D8ZLF5_9HEMI